MANNYKVKVKIEIVECEEKIQPEPKKQKAGQFEYIISGEEGRNIDQCEQAVVSTNAEALRDMLSNHLTEVSKQAVKETAPEEKLEEEMSNNPVSYENPAESVNVSIDDVSVKRQKEERSQGEKEEQKRKYLHNTVSHIQHGKKSYLINGQGIGTVLRLVVAFLLHNDLCQYNLIVFFDGHKTLGKAIVQACSWFKPVQLILDWWHLEKKCKELLSMACRGRQFRNDLLAKLMPLLWVIIKPKMVRYGIPESKGLTPSTRSR